MLHVLEHVMKDFHWLIDWLYCFNAVSQIFQQYDGGKRFFFFNIKIQYRCTCINKIKKTIDFIFFWPIPEKNACDFSPCDNGGRCEVVNGTFFCHCPLGYTGDKCETGKM